MKKNKAPGPDNIPIEFYQHCWDIVKNDIMRLFYAFHDGSLDVQRLNYGIITLVPKGPDADKIQKYRPICLLQVLFKIFTKALTIRAIPIMNKVIHPCQTTFIKGRYITDGVALLQEVMREANSGNNRGLCRRLTLKKLMTR
jgi:hypothetical protein